MQHAASFKSITRNIKRFRWVWMPRRNNEFSWQTFPGKIIFLNNRNDLVFHCLGSFLTICKAITNWWQVLLSRMGFVVVHLYNLNTLERNVVPAGSWSGTQYSSTVPYVGLHKVRRMHAKQDNRTTANGRNQCTLIWNTIDCASFCNLGRKTDGEV